MASTDSSRSAWWIVFAAALALVVGQGAINVFAAGVFLKPVAQELGFGRGEISTAIGLSSVVTAIGTPFFGRLLDRIGVRAALLPSIVLFALATAALSLLQRSSTVLFLLFALSGLMSVGQNPTAYSKVIAAWFDKKRGLAFGIALAGVGLGTALIPQISGLLIRNFGWRVGYVGLGITIFILAFVPVALLVREPPAAVAARWRDTQTASLPGASFAEAVRTWRYWAMTIAFFLASTTINGSLIHVVPLLTDRGIPVTVATGALSAAGFALIGGRVISGYLLDKLFAPYIAIFFLVCPMLGLAVLGTGMVTPGPVVGTILLGAGIGCEVDLMSFIVTRYFGMRAFGSLHGLMFAGTVLGNAAGAAALGWSFQLLHSYGPGFVAFEVLLAIGCILFASLGPYRYPAGVAEHAEHKKAESTRFGSGATL